MKSSKVAEYCFYAHGAEEWVYHIDLVPLVAGAEVRLVVIEPDNTEVILKSVVAERDLKFHLKLCYRVYDRQEL